MYHTLPVDQAQTMVLEGIRVLCLALGMGMAVAHPVKVCRRTRTTMGITIIQPIMQHTRHTQELAWLDSSAPYNLAPSQPSYRMGSPATTAGSHVGVGVPRAGAVPGAPGYVPSQRSPVGMAGAGAGLAAGTAVGRRQAMPLVDMVVLRIIKEWM